MVVVLVVVSSVVLLVLVALYEQHRRRSVLEATIPVGTTRSARRKILRAHRVRVRSTAVRGPAPSLRRLWRWLVIAPLNSRPVRTGRAEWRSRRACFSPKNGDPTRTTAVSFTAAHSQALPPPPSPAGAGGLPGGCAMLQPCFHCWSGVCHSAIAVAGRPYPGSSAAHPNDCNFYRGVPTGPRCARRQRMVVVIRSSKPAGSSGSRNTSAINSSSEMSRMRSIRDRPAG